MDLNSNKKTNGFTLIEILVALTILMMVLFIGSLAYRTYSVYWHKELGDFNADLAEYEGITRLQNLIRNIKPMVFKGGERGGYVYFEGGDSLIRAISNESVQTQNAISAFEISVVQDTSNTVRVEYRESTVIDKPLLSEMDISGYSKPIVILKGFEDIRFEYFGWIDFDNFSVEQHQDNTLTGEKKWFGLYSGKDTLISPLQVKVRFKKDGVWSELRIPLSQFLHKDLLQFIGVDL